MRSLLVIAALLPLLARPAVAMEPWERVLRDQLRRELGCRVIAIDHVRQLELAGVTVIDGHADCEDGRAYDFSRPKPHMRFELRVCQPAVC
jgi:hypothetical protein